MRFQINPKFKELEDFLISLPKDFYTTGESIYSGRNEIKVFNYKGYKINVKSFKIPHLINKVAYAWIRGSKARHSYEYALRMRKVGAETPEPIGYVEVLKGGLFNKSYYISVHHNYDFTIRDLIGFEFEDKDNILKQFAQYTYEKLHKNKIHHLDYSRGNILIKKLINNKYSFSIVDINRMKFEKMPYLKGLKNFSQIWANKDELEVIAKEYAVLNGKNEQEAYKLLIHFDKKHKEKINKKAQFKKKIKLLKNN